MRSVSLKRKRKSDSTHLQKTPNHLFDHWKRYWHACTNLWQVIVGWSSLANLNAHYFCFANKQTSIICIYTSKLSNLYTYRLYMKFGDVYEYGFHQQPNGIIKMLLHTQHKKTHNSTTKAISIAKDLLRGHSIMVGSNWCKQLSNIEDKFKKIWKPSTLC